MANKEGRSEFLREFVKHLILNSSPLTKSIPDNFPNIVSEPMSPVTADMVPSMSYEQAQIMPPEIPQFQMGSQVPIIKIREIDSVPFPINQRPQNQTFSMMPKAYQTKAKATVEGWGKISTFMQDKSVESIECPGSDKALIIMAQGKPISSSISLTKEEINGIMDKIMAETGAAADSNFLKAETSEYKITAVISEFVGSRFIIQKKN